MLDPANIPTRCNPIPSQALRMTRVVEGSFGDPYCAIVSACSFFWWSLFLCHPERSEGPRALQRALRQRDFKISTTSRMNRPASSAPFSVAAHRSEVTLPSNLAAGRANQRLLFLRTTHHEFERHLDRRTLGARTRYAHRSLHQRVVDIDRRPYQFHQSPQIRVLFS
jgi:hypothetical protein